MLYGMTQNLDEPASKPDTHTTGGMGTLPKFVLLYAFSAVCFWGVLFRFELNQSITFGLLVISAIPAIVALPSPYRTIVGVLICVLFLLALLLPAT